MEIIESQQSVSKSFLRKAAAPKAFGVAAEIEMITGRTPCEQGPDGARGGKWVDATISRPITKEVVGIHVLPTRSLFGGDTLRKLLRRVSLAKPTSAV